MTYCRFEPTTKTKRENMLCTAVSKNAVRASNQNRKSPLAYTFSNPQQVTHRFISRRLSPRLFVAFSRFPHSHFPLLFTSNPLRSTPHPVIATSCNQPSRPKQTSSGLSSVRAQRRTNKTYPSNPSKETLGRLSSIGPSRSFKITSPFTLTPSQSSPPRLPLPTRPSLTPSIHTGSLRRTTQSPQICLTCRLSGLCRLLQPFIRSWPTLSSSTEVPQRIFPLLCNNLPPSVPLSVSQSR
jgi:hypothetical protein